MYLFFCVCWDVFVEFSEVVSEFCVEVVGVLFGEDYYVFCVVYGCFFAVEGVSEVVFFPCVFVVEFDFVVCVLCY